jgi:Bacteriophage related domain of unknown function
MTYQAIYTAIEAIVTTAIGETPIQLPNSILDISDAAEWVRVTHLPARPRQVTIGSGGMNFRPGMTQVDVFWKPGDGTTALPDTIVEAFTRATRITTPEGQAFQFIAYRDGGDLVDDAFWQERVLIVWNAITST